MNVHVSLHAPPLEFYDSGVLAQISDSALRVLARVSAKAKPSERLGLIAWAEKNRKVTSGSRQGDFRIDSVPALKEVLEAYEDPNVREIVFRKPSQIGWTVSVPLNICLYHAAQDPCGVLGLFAKDGAAKNFCREKLNPAIKATRALAKLLNADSRNPDNTLDYKGFPGGWIRLNGVGSITNVKSADPKVVFVEEPDDVGHDVKGQGDAIAHGKARTKTFEDSKLVIGGSPTIEDFSAVSEELKISDWRLPHINCPHCGFEQRLVWENVRWLKDAQVQHEVYGLHRQETARYLCANEDCGALWTDREKNEAILLKVRTGKLYQATRPFTGVAGFDLADGGELWSILPTSSMEALVKKFLEARYDEKRGKPAKMVEFVNGTLARTRKLKTDAPPAQVLLGRKGDYPQWTCPSGGLVLFGAVDVQRGGDTSGEPRLEFMLRAFGRGMESWRVAYGQVLGNPLEESTWAKLLAELTKPVKNVGGGYMIPRNVSIDASDGMTSDAVFRFVRPNMARGYLAIKGWSEKGKGRQKEIYTRPAPLDVHSDTKAAKWGLQLYMVGTISAKDTIFSRLKLTGEGPGRMHFDADLDQRYVDGLLSEAKVPLGNGREGYIKKSGVPNEPLDLEAMCLHAAHSAGAHTWSNGTWDQLERELRQKTLFDDQGAPVTAVKERSSNQVGPAQRVKGFT